MIIKSSQRAAPISLANHLTNLKENEQIRFSDSRFLLADDVHGALDDMDDIAKGSNCTKHLYHVSINPDQDLTPKQWQQTWQNYEAEFGLESQPFIEVTHLKQGREHKHRVYERVQENGKAIQLSHNWQRNEKVARKLEYQFGHDLTIGKHNRAVINQLKREGEGEIILWMEQQQAHLQERPVAEKNHSDHQQEKRTKVSVAQVKADLKEAYQNTDNGKAFEAAIAEKNYRLAKGDRRDFVVVDYTGNVHSPRRRIGVKAKELRTKWADLKLEHLPTVEAVKQALNPHRQPKSHNSETSLENLQQERKDIEAEIIKLECQLQIEVNSYVKTNVESKDPITQASENFQARQEQPQQLPEPSLNTFLNTAYEAQLPNLLRPEDINPHSQSTSDTDQRQQIETWTQLQGEGWESIKPPDRVEQSFIGGHSSDREKYSRVTEKILQLTGEAARSERDRRLHLAQTAASKPEKPDPHHKRPIRAYLTALGQYLQKQGRGAYHRADSWLSKKLSQNGYDKNALRQMILRVSPALLEQPPSERKSYIKRLIDRAQAWYEHHKQRNQADKPQSPAQIATIKDSSIQSEPMIQGLIGTARAAAMAIARKEGKKEVVEQTTKKAAQEAAEVTAKKQAQQTAKEAARIGKKQANEMPKPEPQPTKPSVNSQKELKERTQSEIVKPTSPKSNKPPQKISPQAQEKLTTQLSQAKALQRQQDSTPQSDKETIQGTAQEAVHGTRPDLIKQERNLREAELARTIINSQDKPQSELSLKDQYAQEYLNVAQEAEKHGYQGNGTKIDIATTQRLLAKNPSLTNEQITQELPQTIAKNSPNAAQVVNQEKYGQTVVKNAVDGFKPGFQNERQEKSLYEIYQSHHETNQQMIQHQHNSPRR